MSIQQEDLTLPLPKEEIRARAHSERRRIHTELAAIANDANGGLDADLLDDPGVEWRPEHQVRNHTLKQHPEPRHWRSKSWKRRSRRRQQRTQAWRNLR